MDDQSLANSMSELLHDVPPKKQSSCVLFPSTDFISKTMRLWGTASLLPALGDTA